MPSDGNGSKAVKVPTVKNAVEGFVRTANEVLRGTDPSVIGAPQLDVEKILQIIRARTEGSADRLEVETDEGMLDRAMQFLLEWALKSHGVPLVLPDCEELTPEAVGQTIINCALAPQGMDVTPRAFLREPNTIKFLTEIIVVFAKACIDPDLEEEAVREDAEDTERFFWDEGMGAIFTNSTMAAMYARAVVGQEDIEAFTQIVRPKIVALEGDVTIPALKTLLRAVEHELTVSRSGVGTTARGGSA